MKFQFAVMSLSFHDSLFIKGGHVGLLELASLIQFLERTGDCWSGLKIVTILVFY